MTSFIEPNMFDHIVLHSVEQIAPKISAHPVMSGVSEIAAQITFKKNSKVYSA